MGKDVEGLIGYWGDGGQSNKTPEGYKETLLGRVDEDLQKVFIKDMRGHESDYRLDTNGFEAHTLPPKADRDANIPFGDDSEYFEEVKTLIKSVTGAKEVFVWLKVVRQRARNALQPHEFIPGQVQAPSPKAHVDFAPSIVEENICTTVPEAKDAVKNAARWQVLGVWRPTKLVQRDPLVMADARTVADADYVTLPRPLMPGEPVARHASVMKRGKEKEHRWYYWSDMSPEDVLLFKHYDSKQDIPAWRCGHTSAEIPGTAQLPARESFECRAIVVY